MSGQDLVQNRRSTGTPKQSGIKHVLVGFFVVLSVAGVSTLVAKIWVAHSVPHAVVGSRPGPSPMLAATASWTKDDEEECRAKARAAAERPEIGTYQITNRSIAEGVAGLTTMVECQLTKKVTRFCSNGGKAEIVALINDYYDRLDMVALGVGVQGAPMAIAGAFFGGETAAGDGIYQQMVQDTRDFMNTYSSRVVTAVVKLGNGRVIRAEDFRPFPFAGVPERIDRLFLKVQPTSDICSNV